jgi:hypothetical protein
MLFDYAFFVMIVWLLKNAAMDVSCAIKGTPNPRYEMKKQKARAAGQSLPAQPRYGTKDYVMDFVADALAAKTEARRAQAAKKRAAEQPIDQLVEATREKPNAGPSSNGNPAGARGITEPPPAKPTTPRPTVPAPVPPSRPAAPIPAPASDPVKPAPQPTPARVASQAAPPKPTAGSRIPPAQPVAAPAESTPAPTMPDNVIPLFRTPNKEKIMPTVNGEVTGLDPAISYAKALAHFAGEHGQAGNEGYIGFLANSKVSGDGLQSAHDMQEAFANAQAVAERHAAELSKQKTVQEAYNTNPDAGDKAFQQNGQ